MKTAKTKRGFTLIELMLAALASSILNLFAATNLLLATRSWRMNNQYASMRRNAAFAIELMSRDIREAQRPTGVTIAPNTLTINNAARGYIAVFALNPATGVLSYSRNGNPTMPFVAQDIAAFNPSLHTYNASVDGANLHLKMVDDTFNIAITNETFVHMRN